MQRCPKCYRTYQNDAQKYCTACGGRLVPNEELPTAQSLPDARATYSGPPAPPIAPGFDPNQTIQSRPKPAPPAFDPNSTLASPPFADVNKTVMISLPPSTADIAPEPPKDTAAANIAPTIAVSGPVPGLPPLPEIDTTPTLSTAFDGATTLLEDLLPVPAPPLSPREATTVSESIPVWLEKPPVIAPPPVPAPPIVKPVTRPVPATPPQTVAQSVTPALTPPVRAPVPSVTPPAPPVPAAPKSRRPLILGILLGGLVIFGVAAAALFWFVVKPRLEARQAPPAEIPQTTALPSEAPRTGSDTLPPVDVVPPNALQFTNTRGNATGKLAEHYVGFSFYYPKTWVSKPTTGTNNFADLVRNLPNGSPQEICTISWYENSKGTFATDQAIFSAAVQKKSDDLAQSLPDTNYQKISEGPTKVSGLEGYEFRFKGEFKKTGASDGPYWGRVVFLPTGVAGEKNGVTMIMLATSQTPEVKNVAEVGEKGELPIILNTFRFTETKR